MIALIPNNTDVLIGARVRELRTNYKASPTDVAASLKLSLDEYEKGERGERRFNAVEIYYIARTLGVEFVDIVGALKP